ncbi:hypothetical protein LCGC14_2098240 [marine sediment metagenome]|uniref:Uncharacterized protein n=1 Tax=marine sediment metagenome TaxID=412755 RepID=A0A0F9EAX2_9ZZZZ
MAKIRDPNIRTGAITAQDVIGMRVGGECESRWYSDEFQNTLADIYGTHGAMTLARLLNAETVPFMPDFDPQVGSTTEDLADLVHTALSPALLGDKVFRLCLADIAETQLAVFEASGFSNPAPRAMVDGLRAYAFNMITSEDLQVLIEAAYADENNRSDVSYIGKIALLPFPSKEHTDWTDLLDINTRKRSVSELQAILDRMKEYDQGKVDLKNEITARPMLQQ